MKDLEAEQDESTSSFRPMSARLEVIAQANAKAIAEFDENDLGNFHE